MKETIYLDGNSLTVEWVVQIARFEAKVALAEEAKRDWH